MIKNLPNNGLSILYKNKKKNLEALQKKKLFVFDPDRGIVFPGNTLNTNFFLSVDCVLLTMFLFIFCVAG